MSYVEYKKEGEPQGFSFGSKDTYWPEKLQIETWIGRHKDDFYDYKTLPANEFLSRLVKAAYDAGAEDARYEMKKALGLT